MLRTRALGHRDLVTVVGHAATVAPGERTTATGEWVDDRTQGQQFRASFIRTAEPTSLEGIERYRGSGTIHGIGHALAEAMVEGHCVLPGEELGPHVATLLEVPEELIRAALDLELADGAVVADSDPAHPNSAILSALGHLRVSSLVCADIARFFSDSAKQSKD